MVLDRAEGNAVSQERGSAHAIGSRQIACLICMRFGAALGDNRQKLGEAANTRTKKIRGTCGCGSKTRHIRKSKCDVRSWCY